jgi:hypothetical protein
LYILSRPLAKTPILLCLLRPTFIESIQDNDNVVKPFPQLTLDKRFNNEVYDASATAS